MTNNEFLRSTIPERNDWHSVDVRKKAEELGLRNRSELIFVAVDVFMRLKSNDVKDIIEFTTAQRMVSEGHKINRSITLKTEDNE